jgi:predicted phosphodiesterase
MIFWTDGDLRTAKAILKKYSVKDFRGAVSEIESALDRAVTPHALRSVFLRNELGPPSGYCMGEEEDDESEVDITDPTNIEKLVKLMKKGPIGFSELCDKLDLPPSKTRQLVDQAKEMGVMLHVEHNHVGMKSTETDVRVRQIGVAPVVGQRQKIAVISDTHLGSKYCLREQLKEFIHYAYAQGVREILHPGDVLDGIYRHGIFEVSHTGLDDQTQDLFETLPQLPGLTYHGITGNHDQTFTDQSGVDVGHFITNYFAKRGRKDFQFYGNRGAFLKVRGAVVHLWHPRSGVPYARSYGIQKQIEKYTVVKPNLLFTGHWHISCQLFERGVHAFACPTFQGGGSAFGKSIGGSPAIGGLIVSWDLTKDGTLRSLVSELRSYFEVEKPVELENHVDGVLIR